MRKRFFLAAVAFGAGAIQSNAFAQNNPAPISDYAERVLSKYEMSPEQVECIGDTRASPKPRVWRVTYLDTRHFIVEFNKHGTFLNVIESEKGCKGMKKNALVSYVAANAASKYILCRGDSARVRQKTTNGSIPTGLCDIGYFYELKRKAD
ncbi:MAG: hypothetical protein KDA48_16780 [Amphiplicatus sp.]|nr:hypothetical protein [Amphiplicatus sp.]